MVFVVETSRGKLAFQFFYAARRTGLGISVFEFADDGWATKLGDGWSAYKGKQGEFPDFLSSVTGMPREEAEQLSEWAIAAWRERGGEEAAIGGKEAIRTHLQLSWGFTVVVLVPLALATFLVWLAVRFF